MSDARERLLTAAEDLFLRNGLQATTLNDLVAAARLSKRDFYKHFPDRETLFIEVAERVLVNADQQFGEIERLMPRVVTGENVAPGSPAGKALNEALVKLARAIYRNIRAPRSLALLRASLAAAALAPRLSARVYEARSRYFLAKYLEDHAHALGLSFDDPQRASFRFGHLSGDGLRFTIGTPPLNRAKTAQLAEQAAELFLNGHATPAFRCAAHWPSLALGRLQVATRTHDIYTIPAGTRLSADTWERLLSTAWQAFSQRGDTNVNLSWIATEAGISKYSLYRRFGSKERLFEAAAISAIDRIWGADADLSDASGGVRGTLISLSLMLQQRFLLPQNLFLHRRLLVMSGDSPQITCAIYAHLEHVVHALLAPLIARLAESGIISASHAPRAWWRFFVLATFSGGFVFVPPRSPGDQRSLAIEAADMFLFGCRRESLVR